MKKNFLVFVLVISFCLLQSSEACSHDKDNKEEDSPFTTLFNNIRQEVSSFTARVFDNTDESTIQTTTAKVILEEIGDSIKVENLFKKLCEEHLRVKGTEDMSYSKLSQIKEDICERIIVNSGGKLKNEWLGQKMIGYLGKRIVDNVFFADIGLDQNLAKSAEINSEFVNDLLENKDDCWSVEDFPCGIDENLRSYSDVIEDVIKKYEEGKKSIMKYLEKTEEEESEIESLERRRVLFTRKSIKKIKKDIKKKAKKFKSHWKGNKKYGKVVKSQIKIVQNKINRKIRQFNILTEEEQQALFKGIDNIELSFAEIRCEKKYGEQNCKKMNDVSYCYKCAGEFEAYWKEFNACGCRLKSERTNLWSDFGGNKGKKGSSGFTKLSLLRKKILNKKIAENIKMMSKKLDQRKVKDAFFVRVEDMLM